MTSKRRRGIRVGSPPQTADARRVAQKRSRSSTAAEKRARAATLLQREVSFVHSTEFEQVDAEQRILETQAVRTNVKMRRNKPPKDLPAYLACLWETPLLQPEEERCLFRRMNYLKYKSNILRSQLTPTRPSVRVMDRMEQSLQEAEELRDGIIRANLRLVVSIARRFHNNLNRFDDLVSEGNFILMAAVEKFDYMRGFRFSTYATHAIQRAFYRKYTQQKKRKTFELSTPSDMMAEVVRAPEQNKPRIDSLAVRYLQGLMQTNLPPREREIIEARYGLNSDQGSKTLREVGKEFGVSKERIRQIQIRAEERLRELASDDVLDNACDAETAQTVQSKIATCEDGSTFRDLKHNPIETYDEKHAEGAHPDAHL